ncbi:phosphate ABC transporter substrate-binding protein PstS [Microcella sp.]|uniref:phosphate ABC transporter substrate-binding protein PstS n=1 Tax=Microcella sp. TaxID=1913979 RepID=UPI003919551D
MTILRSKKALTGVAVSASLALLLGACASEAEPTEPGDTTSPEAPPAEVQLSGNLEGAGASFPNPVFQEYQFVYSSDVQPGVTINYQSIGSGGGIEQFLLQTVDFGSSERYLRDEDLAAAEEGRGCAAIQFPVLFGAVTLAFGDEQFEGLVLDAETIAGIFQREITNYNDPAIAALNPDFDLPDLEIIPVHRSDGSGTTSVFTTYLEDAASNWTLGSGTEVQWPSGTVGGQGNEGVTAGIEQNEGGIGYVNQAYALVNDLPTAAIVNADGNAVQATLEATTEALEVLEIPDTFQFDILGVGGNGFPIVGANWIFAYECGYEQNTADMLIDYWTWATQSEEANQLAADLGYAVLGDSLKPRVLEAIERINSAE